MFVLSNGYLYFSKYCDDARARVSMGIQAVKGVEGYDWSALKKSERLILARTEDAVTKYVESSNRMQQPILKAEIEEVVKKALGKEIKVKGNFVADFEQMIAQMRSGELLNPKGQSRYSEQTVINYNNCLHYLNRYAKEEGTKLSYNIDEEWVMGFIVWLTKPKVVEKKLRNGKTKLVPSVGYSKNSIAMVVGNVKGFLSHMYRAKKYNSLFFKHGVFNLSREDADTEALSIEEIKVLYNMELSPAREKARDVIVFACWVGLRSNDLQEINNYKLKGNNFEFFTQKTGVTVIIPAHPMARTIYEKYKGNMPVFPNNINLNMHIAKICKDAGFTEQCMIAITRGGKKVAEYYEKWQLLSIHSCRRSFATNAYLAGIKVLEIMLITGHTTEKAFMKYIRITKKENAARLGEHPFFKGS